VILVSNFPIIMSTIIVEIKEIKSLSVRNLKTLTESYKAKLALIIEFLQTTHTYSCRKLQISN